MKKAPGKCPVCVSVFVCERKEICSCICVDVGKKNHCPLVPLLLRDFIESFRLLWITALLM